MPYQVTSRSREDTLQLGERVGQTAKSRLIIGLIGDLGSGKTVFVKGLARGLAVPREYMITSPSYTLINEYPGRIALVHADLYRLANDMDIESTGLFDVMGGDGVVAIEWAERISAEDLLQDMVIHFEIQADDTRKIRITGCGQTGDDLLKELEI
jgi:tRNA threonylcarbamoyladenosine biosynthesis protein TsaE